MGAEVRVQHSLPEWTATFLRGRCEELLAVLATGGRVITLSEEEDSIHCWRLLLLAAADVGRGTQIRLDELHLLHARIVERTARGGVADIAPDVDALVRRILAERLVRLTDAVLTSPQRARG